MLAFKDEIDDLRGEIKVLSRTINDGFESRSVPIRKEPNYRTKQWEFVRLDTGEIYKTQAMSADDLQAAFPFLDSSPLNGEPVEFDGDPVEDGPADEAFRELNEIAEAAGGDLDVSVSFSGERGAPGLESAMEQ